MSIKHKQTIYILMRHDFSGNDVVCAACLHEEDVLILEARYTQEFLDKGFTKEEFYFYPVATTLYTNV